MRGACPGSCGSAATLMSCRTQDGGFGAAPVVLLSGPDRAPAAVRKYGSIIQLRSLVPFLLPERLMNRIRRQPFLLIHGRYPLDQAGILEDLPNELGAVMWQCCRSVTLWATTPRRGGEKLFQGKAYNAAIQACLSLGTQGAAAEVVPYLVAAMEITGENAAVVGSARAACEWIRDWAERAGHLETALAFAQTIALWEDGGDAASAYHAGRLARRLADHARSELWFREAIRRARRAADHDTYCMAYAGLGKLAMVRGDFPSAEQYHLMRYRHAKLWRKNSRLAPAAHDLMTLASRCGEMNEASAWAARAAWAYRAKHPDMPAFAYDLGYLWIQQGRGHEALQVLQALEKSFTGQPQMLVVWSGVVRAAGMAGEMTIVNERAPAILKMAEDSATQDVAAESLLDLARGAGSVELWDLAELAARRASAHAERRKEAQVMFAAEAVLDAIERNRAALRIRAMPADRMTSGLAKKVITELAAL